MEKIKEIKTSKAPQAVGPYSQAVEAGGFVYVSGQIAIDYQTGVLEETNSIDQQTKIILNNLKNILAKSHLNLKDVVKTEIFLTNISDFSVVNEIYGQYFQQAPQPARQTVEVSNLPLKAKIEISCLAKK